MILTRLFGRGEPRAATPENPRFSLNDPAAWDALDGGDPSATGQRVTREIALCYGPWWRGINLLASDCGKLPLVAYRLTEKGKSRYRDSPAYPLCMRRPNPYQTAYDFRRQLTGHALSAGNGYAYIVRDGAARPLELLPLDPDVTYPVRANGTLWYVTKAGRDERKLPGSDVLHIKGFGHDGLAGISVWQKAKDSLGLGLGARKYSSVFLKNNARPSVVLEAPGALQPTAVEALRGGWERMHAGLDNVARTAVLTHGVTAKTISINPEEAQLIQARQFEAREVALFIGVPPHKLGDPTRTAYASLEQENLAYLGESLDPWLIAWEQECCAKLLTEEEQDRELALIEFYRQALLRADRPAMSAYNRTALAGQPWKTVNEVRHEDGLDPIEGGDLLQKPLNMGRGGSDSGPGGRPDETDQAASAFSAAAGGVLAEAVARMCRRIATHAGRAAADGGKYIAWLDGFEDEHRAVVGSALAPAESMIGAVTDGSSVGQVRDWLLSTLRLEYGRVADTASAKDLPGAVAHMAGLLEARLPGEAAFVFLGD